MSYAEQSLREFGEALASSAPAPGGGGASALCGALAAALGEMVANLTIGKKQYAASEERLLALRGRASAARHELLDMIDGDEAAFAPLAKAYALPKDAPGRAETLEECLRTAAAAPLRIAELCCEVIELCEGFADVGSRLVLSDAATGAALGRGALRGALLNVKVNTALMRERGTAEEFNERAEKMWKEYAARADEVCASVAEKLHF